MNRYCPHRRRCLAVVVALSILTPFVGASTVAHADATPLLDGVAEIAAPGVPGPLCVYGPDAFGVVVGGSDGGTVEPVAAAGAMGDGRVVALGHGGYLRRAALETADTLRLMVNAALWAAGGDGPADALRVGVVEQPELAAVLRDTMTVDEIALDEIDGHDVVFWRPWSEDTATLDRVAAYVRAGGGLVMASTGWGWAQLNPELDLQTDFAGNRLLAPIGIQWAHAWLGRTSPDGYAVDGPPSRLTNAGHALDAALAHEAGEAPLTGAELAQASQTLVRAASCAAPDDTLLRPRLERLTRDLVVPSPQDPVTRDEVLDRLAVVIQTRDFEAQPLEDLTAHPAAEIFPGPVPSDAPRIARTVTVETGVQRWHSTGLYAAPGEVLTVRLDAAAVSLGLRLRIGAHTDQIWNRNAWRRMPSIARSFRLEAPQTSVGSPYGGLVYVEVPDGLESGTVEAEIQGAVAAPHFAAGETDAAAWRNGVRDRAAPWAEVEGAHMIVTVPSANVRQLDDPGAVAAAWDRVVELSAELAAWDAPRVWPQRFVADEQISAGYMHAGYPLMCHLDQQSNLVDATHLTTEGGWGFFHEVGHNHQSGDWTFAGTTEVTVNLFTLYIFEHLVGIPVQEHPRGDDDFLAAQMAKYDFSDPDFAQWQSDPFLALAMYVQLQHAFGWEAYRTVFAEYRALPADERPANDAAKRDQWLVRFSRTVGRDLGPFFAAWGVPVSAEARAAVADLPVWMPDGFPPGAPTATPAPDVTPTATPRPMATPTEEGAGRGRLFLPRVVVQAGE